MSTAYCPYSTEHMGRICVKMSHMTFAELAYNYHPSSKINVFPVRKMLSQLSNMVAKLFKATLALNSTPVSNDNHIELAQRFGLNEDAAEALTERSCATRARGLD